MKDRVPCVVCWSSKGLATAVALPQSSLSQIRGWHKYVNLRDGRLIFAAGDLKWGVFNLLAHPRMFSLSIWSFLVLCPGHTLPSTSHLPSSLKISSQNEDFSPRHLWISNSWESFSKFQAILNALFDQTFQPPVVAHLPEMYAQSTKKRQKSQKKFGACGGLKVYTVLFLITPKHSNSWRDWCFLKGPSLFFYSFLSIVAQTALKSLAPSVAQATKPKTFLLSFSLLSLWPLFLASSCLAAWWPFSPKNANFFFARVFVLKTTSPGQSWPRFFNLSVWLGAAWLHLFVLCGKSFLQV